LSVLEGRFPIASLFMCDFSFYGASRGPSASAELLVLTASTLKPGPQSTP